MLQQHDYAVQDAQQFLAQLRRHSRGLQTASKRNNHNALLCEGLYALVLDLLKMYAERRINQHQVVDGLRNVLRRHKQVGAALTNLLQVLHSRINKVRHRSACTRASYPLCACALVCADASFSLRADMPWRRTPAFVLTELCRPTAHAKSGHHLKLTSMIHAARESMSHCVIHAQAACRSHLRRQPQRRGHPQATSHPPSLRRRPRLPSCRASARPLSHSRSRQSSPWRSHLPARAAQSPAACMHPCLRQSSASRQAAHVPNKAPWASTASSDAIALFYLHLAACGAPEVKSHDNATPWIDANVLFAAPRVR